MEIAISNSVVCHQVGIGDVDHEYWGRAEDMTMDRPAFKITAKNPGSDLAAECSAALSSASLAFERSGIGEGIQDFELYLADFHLFQIRLELDL